MTPRGLKLRTASTAYKGIVMLICGCTIPYISGLEACKSCNIYQKYWKESPPFDEKSLEIIKYIETETIELDRA